MFLLNSRLGLFTAALSGLHPNRAPLLPKLRGHFAEFLNESSPDHLRILSSPTCVGLRYGHLWQRTTLFSAACSGPLWVRLSAPPTVVLQPCVRGGFAYPSAYTLQRPIPSGRGPYASASRLALTLSGGTGIFNPFAIAYAFRPRLRSRLTLFRLTLNRNP